MAKTDKLEPVTQVLIAAAVATVLGKNARVSKIRMIKRRSTAWVDSGRLQIHSSHHTGKSLT